MARCIVSRVTLQRKRKPNRNNITAAGPVLMLRTSDRWVRFPPVVPINSGVTSMVDCRVHIPARGGSIPSPASTNMKCKYCRNPIIGKYAKKFCSLSCSASYNNIGRKRNFKHGRYGLKKCSICKNLTIRPKYCSKRCMAMGQRNYSTEEERLKLLRSKRCADFKLYQARKKYNTAIGTDLQAIRIFYLNCPKGYEVDHIIPLSKGGPHDIKNLQYLTVAENRRKGNLL